MMSPKQAFLILYNCVCCAGWAWVWYVAANTVLVGLREQEQTWDTALASVYSADDMDHILPVSQLLAVFEILFALVGLVRSPVVVTAMQVSSRLVALLALVYSPEAQSQWGAGLMILSWASVEVPRYAFYVFVLLNDGDVKKTPFFLFWLRYSLFAVLYPSGIMGELTVFLAAAKDPVFVEEMFSADVGALLTTLYATVLPVIYFFGSPFMIYNMVANRKSSFKKRFSKPPPPPKGLVWPLDKKGQRSSTGTNKAIVSAAVGAVNPTKAAAIDKCKNWRFNYVYHLTGLVEEQCQSPEVALQIAQAGIDKAYELFEFVENGKTVSLQQAMASKASGRFFTGFVKGEGSKKSNVLEVPYKGDTLSGARLKSKIKEWVNYGTIEPSAGDAMIKCVDNPGWLDMSDRYFVLLGAGSAMGPFLVLMALGANVVAIDLDREGIWARLIKIAKASSGSLTFPMKVEQKSCKTEQDVCKQAGCNLFTDTPKIRDWLLDLYPGKPFTVGSYAYLDGALHVQVSLAMDAITRDLSEKRQGTSLAYLCTPTDLHLIPKAAHDAAEENYISYSKKLYCILMHLLSGGKFLKKNAKAPVAGRGGPYYMVNGISVAQGPNYALAKRMQHWRAIIARSKGCTVSSNIAPSTSTVSVVHNRTFAWAYEGMPYFKPFEIFAPETSNSVMSAILFYDLNDKSSAGNPKTALSNPNQLFSFGSFHGGLWRCAYEVDSIGEASVFLYFGRVLKPYVVAGTAAGAALAAWYYSNASELEE